MRIVVLANQDIASLTAINHLLRLQPEHTYHILLSSKVGRQNPKPKQLTTLAFVEQQLFFNILFPAMAKQKAIQSTLDTSPSTTMMNFDTMRRAKIPVAMIDDINSTNGIAKIASLKPNLILSIRFGQILQQAVIDLPEYGVMNLHSGLLPEYRGVMATFWAMLANEQQIGSTLHYIDNRQIDAGRIISRQTIKLDNRQSYFTNVLNLYPIGAQAIADAMDHIMREEKISCYPANLDKGNYYSFPTEKDFAQFENSGLELIDYDYVTQLASRFY